ncbi:MAG: ribosome small subunit-dependent GTPase A [Clostridia bacterium]|nr:ribosome small subunit-dependent GTPase A [Clostridia bacterium]
MVLEGIIIKGIGGFYYVETTKGVFECKAKGKFRKDKISPLTGDRVTITVREDKENTIDEIHERKNKLIRPPVANIDKLMIVVSAAKPVPNYLVIDKMTVLAEKNNIEPVIIITKTDLTDYKELYDTYRSTGYKVFLYSDVDNRSMLNVIKKELNGHLTAFTGNSGVGKSTLINALNDSLMLETGEISDKLGRGRHTTRQAEIFHIGEGAVIDTAGFSSIDFSNDNAIFSDELECYFNEFAEHIGECKFTGCAHLGEKGCKICELVDSGELSRNRYNSYVTLYNEQKGLKRWNL